MCFSNLPLEFDEEGNPYLAEEADEVDRPDEGSHAHAADCDCGAETEVDLAADPEGAYEAIVESLPPSARKHLDERTRRHLDSDAAEGD